jgi:surfactin synthase thioesterase subunit
VNRDALQSPVLEKQHLRLLHDPGHPTMHDVVCFHHAGGVRGTFRSWRRFLPDCRIFAFGFPDGSRSWDGLGDAVAAEIAQARLDGAILFGHSLGALIAYETALALEDRENAPRHLVVSGRDFGSPPAAPLPASDHAFLAFIADKYKAVPEAVLAEPELLAALLPRLRADVELAVAYSDYRPGGAGRLLCAPITAVAGSDDDAVTDNGLAAWRSATRGSFRVLRLDGGHFYVEKQAERVAAVLLEGEVT